MAHRLNDTALVRIFAARATGATLRVIAQEHGISEFTVRRVLAGQGNYIHAPAMYARQWQAIERAAARAEARRKAKAA